MVFLFELDHLAKFLVILTIIKYNYFEGCCTNDSILTWYKWSSWDKKTTKYTMCGCIKTFSKNYEQKWIEKNGCEGTNLSSILIPFHNEVILFRLQFCSFSYIVFMSFVVNFNFISCYSNYDVQLLALKRLL